MNDVLTFLGQHWFEILQIIVFLLLGLGTVKAGQLLWLCKLLKRIIEVITDSVERASIEADTKYGADTIKADVDLITDGMRAERKQLDRILDEQGYLNQSNRTDCLVP